MADQRNSTPADRLKAKQRELATVRRGLVSNDPETWNPALRVVLLAAVETRAIWFDLAARISAVSESESHVAALAELALCLVFPDEWPKE